MPPPDPSTNRLWVGRIAEACTEADIQRVFARFGALERVALQPTDRHDQYGFVNFKSAADAAAARAALDGQLEEGITSGRPLRVEFSSSRPPGGGGGTAPSPGEARGPGRSKGGGCRVFIGNIDPEVTEDDVWSELLGCGEILAVRLSSSARSGGTTQFAHVEFGRPEDAEAIIQQLDGSTELWMSNGRELRVQWAGGGGKGGGDAGNLDLPAGAKLMRGHLVAAAPPKPLVWVGNLGTHAKEADVRRLFSNYGEVQSVRLDQALNTCQFAFVGYRTADEAQQAVEALDATAHPLGISTNNLKLRYAEPATKARVELPELATGEEGWASVEVTAEELAGAGRSLWVGNMRALPTKLAVERVFAKFGKMERMSLTEGKRFCFVDYFDKACAARAVKTLNGKAVPSLSGAGGLVVEYASDAGDKGGGGAGGRAASQQGLPPQQQAAAPPRSPSHSAPGSAVAAAAVAAAAVAAAAQGPKQPPTPPTHFLAPMGLPPSISPSAASHGSADALLQLIGGGLPQLPTDEAGRSGERTPSSEGPPSPAPTPAGGEYGFAPLPLEQPPPPQQQQHQLEYAAAAAQLQLQQDQQQQQHLQQLLDGPLPPALEQQQHQQQHQQQLPPLPASPLVQHPEAPPGVAAAQRAEPAAFGPLLAAGAAPHAPLLSSLPSALGAPPPLPQQRLPSPPQQPQQQQQAVSPPPHGALPSQGRVPPPPPLTPLPIRESCTCCGATEATQLGLLLRACTGCNVVKYCGPSCQLADWNGGHHAECKGLAKLRNALQGQTTIVQAVRASLDNPYGRDAALLRRAVDSILVEEGRK